MPRYNQNRFTVYDVMDKQGVFELNPANADSRNPDTGAALYKGPVSYPKMLFHPDGASRITVPAELISTPMGPKAVGEQRELVHLIVQDEVEEKKLLSLGWHDSPGKAIRARDGLAPETSPNDTIMDLQGQIAALQLKLNSQQERELAKQPGSGGGSGAGSAPPPPVLRKPAI